jgi:hypothetical protein
MAPERTELEWVYQPRDLFEVAYRYAGTECELVIESGRAVATLSVPQDPVDPQLEKRIMGHLEAVLLVRQLQVHRVYDLQGPRIYQHAGGRKNVAIRVGAAYVVVSGGQADFVHRDAAGNVLRDTKAERIAEHTAMLDSVAPKLALSSTLRGLLTSYSRSVSDPGNEFVHLYEIRDAIATHYGGEQNACAVLNISRSEWRRLGVLANVEPIEQGRHRGEHVAGRRAATAAELEEARSIARRWIVAFAGIT